jgi:hypothetical protein
MRASCFCLVIWSGLFLSALASAQASQTVSFAPAPIVGVGVSPISLTATASSGLTEFTFSTSSATSICTVAGNTLAIAGIGTCALTATQAGDANFASASASADVSVVASQSNVTLIGVQSRKTHGAMGTFDLPISTDPATGVVNIEPRAPGFAHNIVFQYSAPVTFIRQAKAVDAQGTLYGTSLSVSNSEVTVSLPGLPDNKSLAVSLLGVNNSRDQVVLIGFQQGDANSSGSVNLSDLSAVKARSGSATTAANYKFDFNGSGSVNASDISVVKARLGLALPLPPIVAAPSIGATSPTSGTTGLAYAFTFTATGTAPVSWTVAAGSLPPGIALNAATGTLSGTTNSSGTYAFTVQASNGVPPNATKSMRLQIDPFPFINSPPPPTAGLGVPYTHTFTAIGAQPIAWSVGTGALPTWATLDANTGVLSGTPTGIGSTSFTVVATNAAAFITQPVTLTVSVPEFPVISNATPPSAAVGVPYYFLFLASGSAPITWNLVSGALPDGITLSSTGQLSGTPTALGSYTFSVQANNGINPNAISAFTIVVKPGDASIEGLTLPNPSKQAFVFGPVHIGLNGAGSEVNAYALDPTRCSTTPALTRSWQHNIDLDDYKSKNAFDFFVLQANEALSYRFTVGLADVSGGFIYNESANAIVRPTFISITSAPCDFDTSKLVIGPTRDACYQTGLNGNGVNWVNVTGLIPPSYCRLLKGQTYYLNLRFQDARPANQGGSPTTDSCTTGNCGGIIQVL